LKIKTKYKPIALNFLGGPGTGKSSLATMVFSELKWLNINTEYVSEYAKRKTWEKSPLSDQVYIFGKQQHEMEILRGQVDVIVTDSPLLISHLYYTGQSRHFLDLVMDTYNSYTNINVLLERVKPYHPVGRSQTKEEALQLDVDMEDILATYTLPFYRMRGEKKSIPTLVNMVLDALKDVETVAETNEKEQMVFRLTQKGFDLATAKLMVDRVPELRYNESFMAI
jgi:nicotinamide riboside kinase